MSLRRRLLAGTGIGVGLALLVSGVLVYVLARRALVAQFDDALAAKVRALAMLVEQDDGRIEFEDISTDTPPGEYFELWDPSGKALLRSKSLGDRDIAAIDGIRVQKLAFSPRSEDDTAGVKPLATFAFGRSTDDLDATVAQLRNIIVIVGLLTVLLAVGVLAWVARYGLRPVDRLAADIAAIREDKLAKLATDRPDELVPIVERLNDLLGRVDRAMTRERELTAEVAHELRTPLAGLRATIEVALDRERPPERYRTALADSLAICTQTERMVESMLSLAKLDAGMVAIDKSEVAIDALVRDVLASHAARMGTLDVTTKIEASTVRTDAAKLASVLHNLVDNAISYGDKTIEIVVKDGEIRIANNTTLETADHVFDRFWRGDTARTAGHAGLGLSICRRLVEAIGGSIRAEVIDKQFVVIVVVDRSASAA